MSPIFVRPVREQLEHDRLIRFLQGKYKRKFEVAINVGDERTAPVKIGATTVFPDLVVTDGRKLAGVIEVESGESVNNLEAMAQWVPFARARVPFHLYVPVQSYDVARRLSDANQVDPAEIWTYRAVADGFDLVRVFHSAAHGSPARPRSDASKKRGSPTRAKTQSPSKKPLAASTKRAPVAKTASRAAKKAGRAAKPAPAKHSKR